MEMMAFRAWLAHLGVCACAVRESSRQKAADSSYFIMRVLRFDLFLAEAALADGFIDEDACGNGHVERGDVPHQGDFHPFVAQ